MRFSVNRGCGFRESTLCVNRRKLKEASQCQRLVRIVTVFIISSNGCGLGRVIVSVWAGALCRWYAGG